MKRDNNFFELLRYRVDKLERSYQDSHDRLAKVLESKRWKYAEVVANAMYKLRTFDFEKRPSNLLPPVIEEPEEVVFQKVVPKLKSIKNIDIINYKFFDFDGVGYMNGGAERYVYDLAQLLRARGKKVRILQVAHKAFKKTFNGIQVVGVPVKHTDWRRFQEASLALKKETKNAHLVIASPLELACEIDHCLCVGINHGFALDGPIDFSTYTNEGLLDRYGDVFRAIDKVEACVCVDTNFMNWVQAFDYDGRKRLQYVPNYYDAAQFKPVEKKLDGKLIFTFPRRISDYRGADITLAAFDRILAEHSDKVELRLVGQYHSKENQAAVEALIERYPNNVSHQEVAMHAMPSVYQESHVILVPTKWSEGTSLSCIEAMASNNAVIATNVGGLPNLVIDSFNGLLINPTSEALEEACLKLIHNPKEISRLAGNAVAVSKTFTKQVWEDRWLEIIGKIEDNSK